MLALAERPKCPHVAGRSPSGFWEVAMRKPLLIGAAWVLAGGMAAAQPTPPVPEPNHPTTTDRMAGPTDKGGDNGDHFGRGSDRSDLDGREVMTHWLNMMERMMGEGAPGNRPHRFAE